MALDETELVVAATGYIYTNDTIGIAPPSPDDIDDFNVNSFGGQTSKVKITGAPTGGTFTITVGGQTTTGIAYNATTAQVKAAVEALSSVGTGNTTVTGTSLTDSNGFDISFAGARLGQTLTVTASGSSLTGGTTPTAVATTPTAASGWVNVGHTSRAKLPELAYDGGRLEMKGSWQKQRLRQAFGAQPIEDHMAYQLEQWNRFTLEQYFGADIAEQDGVFGVSGDWLPVEKAFLVVLVDQFVNLGCYAPKASIARDAAVNLSIDDFSMLPVRATFLDHGTDPLYQWISNDLIGPVPA